MSCETWSFDCFRLSPMKVRGERDGEWYWKAVTKERPYRFVWSGWAERGSEEAKEAIREAYAAKPAVARAVDQATRNVPRRVRDLRRSLAELIAGMSEADLARLYASALGKRVETAKFWIEAGHFQSAGQERGAMMLAYQQGLDGMGESVRAWMGLTDDEFAAWHRA